MTLEPYGLAAITFAAMSFASKTKSVTLYLGFIALFFTFKNYEFVNASDQTMQILYMAIFVSIVAIISHVFNLEKIRIISIKLSFIPAFFILYTAWPTIEGVLSSIGFLVASIAKLQKEILWMKVWFLLSAITWFIVDFFVSCQSCKIMDALNTIILLSSIYFILAKRRTQKECE